MWDHFTSAGAPAPTRASITAEMRGSWVPVVNFPSEKVPAPPSPNCTLEAGSSAPPAQKPSTLAVRASTMPFRARNRAANSPAGPIPTTTGMVPERRFTSGNT